jgi:hypothetical protein
MGTITRSFANNITTSGVLLPASLTNNSIANVTAYNAAIVTGNMILLSSQTANNSASISFTSGISSTYKEYQFYFIDIHPRTNLSYFQFQTSTNGGSTYATTVTSTFVYGTGNESSTAGNAVIYNTSSDQAQGTSYQLLSYIGSGADESCVGNLSLFNPSSTTYVKHFIANFNGYPATFTYPTYVAGYFNTTSAINAINFQMSSGNFDGTILMYGII